jgi:hypothetical protein
MARVVVVGGRLVASLLVVTMLAACAATDVAPPVETASPAIRTPVASETPAPPTPNPSPPTVRVDALAGASPAAIGPGAYRYRVEVPQLQGGSTRARAVDVLIRAALQRDVDAFVNDAGSAQALSELTCTSRTVRLAVRLAVLRVDCTERVPPADPSVTVRTFNCDLAGGRVLALQDLFGQGSRYLDVLSTAARSQLRSRLPTGDDRMLDDGTAPVADNFRAFLLGRDALVIVLPGRYRVAGATGLAEVPVPYEDLQRYLARGVTDLVAG